VKIKGKCNNPNQFVQDVGDALYGYAMDVEGANAQLDCILIKYGGSGV